MRNDMWKMIAIGFVLVTGLVLLNDNSEAMTQCQKKHSYDTCFYSLNR